VTNSPAQNPVPPEAPVSHRSQYLILSSEVRNGGWAGSVPAGGYGSRLASTTRMTVDYVRSYVPIPAPVLSVTNRGAGKVSVTFPGLAGVNYVLERSSNFVSWAGVETNTAPSRGPIVQTISASMDAAAYRVRCDHGQVSYTRFTP